MNNWKYLIFPMVLLLLCLVPASVPAAPPAAVKISYSEARVALLDGAAEISCPEDKLMRSLKVNDTVRAGCEVSTGAGSRIELVLPDKSRIRFAEKSKFKFVQIDRKETGEGAVAVSLSVGKAWSNVRKSLSGKEGKFEISCQNAVAGVRGTIYRMDVATDQSALVKVYDGEVSVAGLRKTQQNVSAVGPPQAVAGPTPVSGPKPVSMEQWVYIVKSMQKIHIDADGKAREPESFTEEEDVDRWTKWNKRRDRKSRID